LISAAVAVPGGNQAAKVKAAKTRWNGIRMDRRPCHQPAGDLSEAQRP
jgi:hypothetical protein